MEGNKALLYGFYRIKGVQDLMVNDPLRYKNFQFSIINVLPNTSLRAQVIELESIIKEKLGTRVFGLNAN